MPSQRVSRRLSRAQFVCCDAVPVAACHAGGWPGPVLVRRRPSQLYRPRSRQPCKVTGPPSPLPENALAHPLQARTLTALRRTRSSGMTTVQSFSSQATSSFASIAAHSRNIRRSSTTCWPSHSLPSPILPRHHLKNQCWARHVQPYMSQTRPRTSGTFCVPSFPERYPCVLNFLSTYARLPLLTASLTRVGPRKHQNSMLCPHGSASAASTKLTSPSRAASSISDVSTQTPSVNTPTPAPNPSGGIDPQTYNTKRPSRS